MNDLISRSALLEHGFFVECEDGFYASVVKSVDIRNAPAVGAGPKWISVKDRLPEPQKTVLAYGFLDATLLAYYDGARWHANWDSSLLAEGFITHWMPLPEPPKAAKP